MNAGRPLERLRRPAVAQWFLDSLLPSDADAVNGDLAEAYEARRERDGERAANRWYGREVVVTLLHIGFSRLAQHRLAGLALLIGTVAGVLSVLFGVNSPAILLMYVGMILVLSLYLSAAKVRAFGARLIASAGAFMTMTSILYVCIIVFVNPRASEIPLAGHVWRIGLMLLIAAVVGAIAALVSADSLRARLSLPAVFLPWLSYGYWFISGRPPWWREFHPALVLIPFESYRPLAPSLPVYNWRPGRFWLGVTLDMAVWTALAILTALLIERTRDRARESSA